MTERWKEIRRQMIDETNSIECDPKGMRSWSDLFNDACKRIAELEAETGNLERLNERNVRQADESFVRAQQLEAENKRLRDALAERRWIPVGERLPDEVFRCSGGYLMVRCGGAPGCDPEFVYPAWYSVDDEAFFWPDENPAVEPMEHVTHWMPLPKPPEVSDGD